MTMETTVAEVKRGDEMDFGQTTYKVTQVSRFPGGVIVVHFDVYAPSLGVPYVAVRQYRPHQKLNVRRNA
jgi:hypothetical protein